MPKKFPLPIPILIAILLPLSAQAAPTGLILETNPGTTPSGIAAAYGLSVSSVAPGGAPYALFTVDSSKVSGLQSAFSSDPRIAVAQPNASVSLVQMEPMSRGGTIAVIGSQDNLDAQNVNLLGQIHWDASMRSLSLQPVKVATLDTGVSPLASALWLRGIRFQNQVGAGLGATDLPNPIFPLTAPQNQAVGHGTMVAGLLGELAPNAQFIFERVADSSGQATVWSLICGLTDAVNSGAQLVNISLGGPGPYPALESAIGWAQGQGVIVVAPAGNNNANVLLEPAGIEGVVPVAGVDANDLKASFSNWSSAVSASAPVVGVGGVSWNGQIAVWTGTSFGAPLVSGALCLALGSGAEIAPDNVNAVLLGGGDSLEALDPAYAGMLGTRLNVANLLQANAGMLRRP